MSTEEIASVSHRKWYFPHQPVFYPKKPDKIREVFLARATCEEKGLNNSLYTVPDLLNSLVGILLRFRKTKIALTDDVEAIFHQVKVTKTDWLILQLQYPDTYQMTVHIFCAIDFPYWANHALKLTDPYEEV